MKKQLLIFLIALPCVLCNCRNNTTASSGTKEDNTVEAFYPIGNFIRSQLIYIDSMPLAVLKYTTINHVTDTSIVDKKNFKAIAATFMTPDIGSPELKPQYEETSFIDATLGTITLTYAPNNEKAVIRKADILLKQENTGVKTIYIEKSFPGIDSTVTQKMLWTANRGCQITTLVQKKDQPEAVTLERYVWDDRD
ncbi:hypothetical protein [Agriterribacter sp.]|uniref:hypothetical protein n=1 Tax=Agriterribacter sp. TaxID=2821509 RepID=UPI002CA5A331|nr:hypothetical protein [Agriterribacter sp.]HRO45621.1 hypothetical protein [Agriterribacter sp.]HRQ17442.1 hypothetical protein [Agriterribacter sp.]